MGVVYEAVDSELQRPVALKVMWDGTVRRLRREAIAAAKLRHPNIVTIYEVGPDFIAMELVSGRTLTEAMPGMQVDERVRVLEQICKAVAFAHAAGVVHRD